MQRAVVLGFNYFLRENKLGWGKVLPWSRTDQGTLPLKDGHIRRQQWSSWCHVRSQLDSTSGQVKSMWSEAQRRLWKPPRIKKMLFKCTFSPPWQFRTPDVNVKKKSMKCDLRFKVLTSHVKNRKGSENKRKKHILELCFFPIKQII